MKRLISAILSLTMIATLFGIIPFSASAADGDVNLLTGIVPTYEFVKEGADPVIIPEGYSSQRLIDGNDTNHIDFSTAKFVDSAGVELTNTYFCIKYDLGHVCDASYFKLANNSNGVLCPKDVDVYFSETAEGIFDAKNLIKDITSAQTVVEETFATAKKGRYLAVKINYPTALYIGSNPQNMYPRVAEITLKGVKPADSTYGTNLLSEKSAEIKYTTDGGQTMVKHTVDPVRLTDGVLDKVCYIDNPKFAENVNGTNVYYTDGKKVWLDIKFDLGAVSKINFFRMYGNTYDNEMLTASRFNVYFSQKDADLFTDASKVIERDTYDSTTFAIFEQALETPVTARYVGVRILYPVRQNLSTPSTVQPRIAEIQAFGEVDYGSNLISGVKATAQHTTDGGNTIVDNPYDLTRLTDGNKEALCYINEPLFAEKINGESVYYTDGTKVWLDIKFDLGQRSTLNKLNVFNNTNGVLAVSKFNVYFSNEEDSLFNSENLEIVHNKHLGTQPTDLEFDLGSITGRYMGIRVLFPCTLNTSSIHLVYTTFREIELLGTTLDLDHTVTFKDSKGNTVYECYAEADGGISATDLAAAKAALPDVYGYKLSDEVWDADITAPIVADTTFNAIYVRDTETEYTIKVGEEEKSYTFDYRVDFVNKSGATTWLVNGQFYDYSDKISVYTFGDYEVTTSDAAAPTAPVVSVVGTADPAGKFITFVRVYNPTDEEIVGYGVRFTSGTVYGMMNGCEWDDDSIAAAIPEYTANKSKYIADYTVNAAAPENYMVTLKGVGKGKARYAKAYITLAGGEKVFSDVSGNAATK